MKKGFWIIGLLLFCGGLLQVSAQSAQKSSGVVKLEMKKDQGDENVKPEEKQEESARTNEGSVRVRLPMQNQAKTTAGTPEQTIITAEGAGITWIAPTMNTIRTSENVYTIRATANANENIRFINLFNNGQFVHNIIPPVSNIKQMVVEEPMELELEGNNLKLEVVTVSGAKIESSVNVIYDISSAKYYALIIAVEEYDDPNISDLDQPINDATRFSGLISSEYNFQKDYITFMKNPTKADIIGKLHEMRNVITPQDNLLIYYAGHGWWDEEMETGYWLPRDASRDNPVNWLPNTDLTNYLNVLKSKHTLLIADACFSGGIFKSRAAFNNILSVERLYKLTSRKAITSGTLTEVPDKSVFIEYLIKRLDENGQKYLPSEQLFSSMKEAVINNSKNIPQYGTIQNVGDEGGDFIFIRRD